MRINERERMTEIIYTNVNWLSSDLNNYHLTK